MRIGGSVSPNHVGRVDVLDVAHLSLAIEVLFDARLHERPDRGELLVTAAVRVRVKG